MVSQYDLDFAKVVMPAFIDTAKIFSQLSVGALVLSIAFQQRVLGRSARRFVTHSLVGCWILLLIAVGSGALYQWTAVHFIDYVLAGRPDDFYPPAWWASFMQPEVWYAVMMVTFFSGALLLVVGSAQQLYRRGAEKREPMVGMAAERLAAPAARVSRHSPELAHRDRS